MVVVLPAPLRPTNPTISPFLTSKLILSMAGACLDENTLVTSRISSKALRAGVTAMVFRYNRPWSWGAERTRFLHDSRVSSEYSEVSSGQVGRAWPLKVID